MPWTNDLRRALLDDNENFCQKYAAKFTLKKLGEEESTITTARLIVRRLTELMPDAIVHRSPAYSISPKPWLVISRINSEDGKLDGKTRIVLYFHERKFSLGLSSRDGEFSTAILNSLAHESDRGEALLAVKELPWVSCQGEFLTTAMTAPTNNTSSVPELADGKPLAAHLQRVNSNVFRRRTEAQAAYLEKHSLAKVGVCTPHHFDDVVPPDRDIEFDPEIRLMKARNYILYGPPGTGKTHLSIAAAVALKDPDDKAMGEFETAKVGGWAEPEEGSRASLRASFDGAIKDGRIIFTTFHQSYAYEDFIEGVRVTTKNGRANYAVRNGIFKRLARKALFYRAVKRPQEVDDLAFETAAERYAATSDEELKKSKTRIRTISSEFNAAAFRLAGGDLPSSEDWPQADEAKRLVLVIDEINRGNISKIFGELITLIEDSKRFGLPEALSVTLPYSGETFTVPDNLYIVGTMNTADRSLATLDVALRRRFEFVEMTPRPDFLAGVIIDGVEIAQWLAKLNNRIQLLRCREFLIGHALFSELRDKDRQKIKFLVEIMRRKILPLLEEYFFDDWEGIRKVLGDVDGVNNLQEGVNFVSVTEVAEGMPAVKNRKIYDWNYAALDKVGAYTKLYKQEQNSGQ